AELRELVEGSGDDRAQQAWISLTKITARLGNWPSLFCEDVSTAQAVVDIFGSWIACAEFLHVCSPQMEASKQKEFLRAYRIATRRSIPSDSRYLPGQSEVSNREALPFWNDRWRGNGLSDYQLQVVRLAVEGTYNVFRMPCSIESGQLSPASISQLERGEAVVEMLRPAGRSKLQLTSGGPKQLTGEAADNEIPMPNEVRGVINSAAARMLADRTGGKRCESKIEGGHNETKQEINHER